MLLVQLTRHSNHLDLKPLKNGGYDIKFIRHNDIKVANNFCHLVVIA